MPEMTIVPEPTADLLDNPEAPALSSTSDMPVVETKPDAQNEGAPPAAPEPEQGSDETEAESATAPEAEPSANDKAPKAKGVQKRLDELVKQREDAERRASEEREEKLRLLAIVEGRDKSQPETKAPDADPEPAKPLLSDFPDTYSFQEALLTYADKRAEWAAARAVKASVDAAERKREQDAIADGIRKSQEQFSQRRTKAMEKYADFAEVADTPNVKVPQIVVQAIIHHERGPELQYFLGKNPQEAERLSAIDNPLIQAIELGSLLGRLDATPPAKPAVSNAPPPIKPISGGVNPAVTKSLYDIAQTGSMEEYAAARKPTLNRRAH